MPNRTSRLARLDRARRTVFEQTEDKTCPNCGVTRHTVGNKYLFCVKCYRNNYESIRGYWVYIPKTD